MVESRVNQRTYHEMLKCKEVLGVPFACGTQVFFAQFFLALCFYVLYICHIFFSPSISLWSFALCWNSLCLNSSSVSLYLAFLLEGVCCVYLLRLFLVWSVSQSFDLKVVVYQCFVLPHSGKDSTETTGMKTRQIIVNWKKSCFALNLGRSDWSEAVKCVDCFCAPT